jgi:hypothetical protein
MGILDVSSEFGSQVLAPNKWTGIIRVVFILLD